jgi:hypothetical protein
VRIGDAIASIDFSPNERNRIARNLRDTSSAAYKVVTQKTHEVHDQDFWRLAQKDLKVHGFRPGYPAAREHVLRRMLSSVRDREGSEIGGIWRFYRNCVIHYVIDDLPELNEVLRNEDLLEDARTLTVRVFASIRRAMPLYKTSNSQVRELYDLWGFDRTDSLDAILTDESLTSDVVKRLIAREIRSVTTLLKEEIGALRDHIIGDLGYRERIVASRDVLQRIDAIDERIRATEATHERVSGLCDTVTAIDARVAAIQSSRPAAAPSQQTAELGRLDDAVRTLRGRVESISASVNRHQKHLTELGTGARSLPNRAVTSRDDEPWASVLTRVRSACASAGVTLTSNLAARVAIELLRHARVIVSPRQVLAPTAILASEPYEKKTCAASPVWIDAADWRDAITFISDFSSSPRTCVLLDFDVALQDSYLVPTLRSWIASIPRFCRHRLILVPADASLEALAPRSMECSLLMSDSADFLALLNRAAPRAGIDRLPEAWSDSPAGYPLSFDEVSYRNSEDEVRRVVENMGTGLPPQVATRFASILHGLDRLVAEQHALQLASECTLLPWYRCVRGEGAARVLADALRPGYGAT